VLQDKYKRIAWNVQCASIMLVICGYRYLFTESLFLSVFRKTTYCIATKKEKRLRWLHSLRYKPVYHNIHSQYTFFLCKAKGFRHFIYLLNELAWMNRLDSRESLVKVHDFLFPSLLFDLLMYLLPIRLNFQRKNTQFLQRKNKEKFDTC